MYEIYDHHAREYDRLVSAEDHRGNLSRYLRRLTDWSGKTVLEAGVGTGRLTEIYAEQAVSITCCDRSSHMMEAASLRLSRYSRKTRFLQADNLSMPLIGLKADLFIEGWSWGHSVVDHQESVRTVSATLLEGAFMNLTDNGTLIIVETMGTNVSAAGAPHPSLAEFYRLLEEDYSFNVDVIRTDYSFETVEEAAETMGFFFGADMEEAITRARIRVVPEWTGVWTKRGR